jgi:hypothetical protein
MIGKFFYTPRARQFNFKPRFYDPEKEEREERERRIKEELGIVNEKKAESRNFRPNIKGQFRNADGLSRSSEDARKSQNKRLLYLIAILALIFYLFFYSGLF